MCRGYTKFDLTVDEGKGRLNLSRDRKLRHAPQKKKKKNSGVAFLLCDPGWCVHILTERCSLTSRINGMTTNKTKTKKLGLFFFYQVHVHFTGNRRKWAQSSAESTCNTVPRRIPSWSYSDMFRVARLIRTPNKLPRTGGDARKDKRSKRILGLRVNLRAPS